MSHTHSIQGTNWAEPRSDEISGNDRDFEKGHADGTTDALQIVVKAAQRVEAAPSTAAKPDRTVHV